MPRKRLAGSRAARTADKIKITVNLWRHGQKWQKSKTFVKATSTPKQWAAWQDAMRLKYAPVAIVPTGSLTALVTDYLKRPKVQAMPTVKQREAHCWAWVAALGGDRSPTSVTGAECDAVMLQWAVTPTNQWTPGARGRRGRPSAATGLSAESIKKRRASFRALFSTMFGKGGFNPVKDSECPRTARTPDERGIPMADARQIVDAMPPWCYPRKGVRVPAFHKVVARIILETGWPPASIGTLARPGFVEGLTAASPTVQVGRRLKGGGVEARRLPVSPEAVAALLDFAALDRFGPISEGPTNVAVKHAAARAGVAVPPRFHAYDLRHAFGTQLAVNGETEATIGHLMLHAKDSTQARRYTAAARSILAASAVAKLGGGRPVPGPVPNTARFTARSDNIRLVKHLQRGAHSFQGQNAGSTPAGDASPKHENIQ